MAAGETAGQPVPQDLQFGVRPHHSGLLNAVALWAGFEQLPQACEEARSPRFLVALRSNLPIPLPAASIQVPSYLWLGHLCVCLSLGPSVLSAGCWEHRCR